MVMLSKMINKKHGHEYLIFLQLNFNSDAIFNRSGYYCTTGPELNVAWMGK